MWQPRRRRPPACPQASPVPSCYEASPGKGGQGTGPAHSRPLRAEGLGRCAPRGGQPLPDVSGHGPGRLHSCTVRSRLPAPLSCNHLNAPSDASLSECHHGVTGPLGCHWRCLPGTGRPGCLGASHHSAGLIPHLMSHKGARAPVGMRPGPRGAPVGPQLLVQTGAPGEENMAGGMRLLQSLRS